MLAEGWPAGWGSVALSGSSGHSWCWGEIQRAADGDAVPGVGDAAVQPAPDGLGVNLHKVGELLGGQPRRGQRDFEGG